MNWKDLTSISDLNDAISSSENRLVVLFKHSTRCSISRMSLKILEMGWDSSLDNVDVYYLDLLKYRDVSNSISEQLSIEHQSPQLLVLHQGKVLGVSNHSGINAEEVKKHL